MRNWSFFPRQQTRRSVATLAGLAVAALLFAAAPAWAATYYLAPGGSDSNTGTTLGSAWATLSKANSTLLAGDVVLIQPGTYSGNITPSRDGTASARISYVGSLSSPASIVVGGITLNGRAYISVKGVTATGNITMNASAASVAAAYDSVAYVRGLTDLDVSGGLSCYVGRSTIGDDGVGDQFIIGAQFGDTTRYCVFEDNTFNLVSPYAGYASTFHDPQYCSFRRNRFNSRLPNVATVGTDVGIAPRYGMKGCVFSDNKWVFTNNNESIQGGAGNPVSAILLRDRCEFNSWTRDTFLVSPTSTYPVRFRFAQTGSYDGQNRYNSWTDCFFQSSGQNDIYLDAARGYRFTGNVFVMNQPMSPTWADSCTFRHNTFINTGSGGLIGCQSSDNARPRNCRFVGNIFYGSGSASSVPVNLCGGTGNTLDSNLVYTPNAAVAASWASWAASSSQHSYFFDPQFQDSTWGSCRPTPSNPLAFSTGYWAEGYVGAIPFGGAVGDNVAPGAVGDLALALVSDHTVVLRWTATGDDGTAGQAAACDLRWSSQPITAANFAAATPVATPPLPAAAGVVQSYVLTDLTASTTFYYALKTVDEAGNWSGLSNVLQAATKATDTVPPATITLGP